MPEQRQHQHITQSPPRRIPHAAAPASFEDAMYAANVDVTIAVAPLMSGAMLSVNAFHKPVTSYIVDELLLAQLVFVPIWEGELATL